MLQLGCLNGVRAVASLVVVLVHCWTHWCSLLDGATRARLTTRAWLPWVAAQGTLGADVLVVLSALLATYHLVPALEGSCITAADAKKRDGDASGGGSCWAVVRAYWRRRAARILPAYAAANLLMLAAFAPAGRRSGALAPDLARAAHLCFANCPRGLVHNALLRTNTLSVQETCGAHLWTVCVLAHFYLAYPLLLAALAPRRPGFRARLATALALAAVGGAAWRLRSALQAGFLLPFGDTHEAAGEAALLTMLRAVYLTTASRVVQLAAGAALGLALRSHAATSWLLRRRVQVSVAALALQAAYLASVSFDNLAPPPEPRLSRAASAAVAAFGLYGSPFLAALITATLAALLTGGDPLHRAAASALAAPAWRRPADLSYSLYLLHELAKFEVVARLPPGALPALAARAPQAALAAMVAGTLAAGYAAAWVCWRFVERRF